ncbi:TPA: NTP transferase domain-containing protein [archaeon]|uniref:NTP transferase domain-containing protein n=1 Tax=Candidatus Naiadarchaeum limnaeum TaxID=2756139 RepID=A0A832V1G5_9ARCH|nr:NTP transferase domain-containing protein [Candidatus Naiadarchaeales archaeon SRR2090153.bin1042]HIK00433.1 NTP transferase domain-containing protein [Candidatus Naiadarchaeum limnaeum]
MQSIVLAAGEGTRMLPLTSTRPKPMLPIANKPILEHIVNALKKAGVKEAVVVQDPSRFIENYFKDGKEFGIKLKYIVQAQKLGTAHAISLCESLIKDDNFLVINGDNFVRVEVLADLVRKHKGDATITLLEVPDRELMGTLSTVKFDADRVVRIIEKPTPGQILSPYASIGTYVFSQYLFDAIKKIKKSPRGELELPTAMQLMLSERKKMYYVKTHYWQHISYPWDLLTANKMFLDETKAKVKGGEIEKNVTIKGKLLLGKNSIIKSGTYIEGSVMIGDNCTIGPNCFLRSYVCLGNNVRVGNGVEIKNSIIMDGTHVPHLSYVGDSLIGQNVNFGAGAILTNFRLDGQNIKVLIKDKLVDSGLRKLGAIVGDNVKFGSNVVVNPGKRIGANSLIWPGRVITEDVPDSSEIK